MSATAPAPKYTVDQQVEVLACDFTTPGFPRVWQAGVVEKAEWRTDDRLWAVMVRTPDGARRPLLVGPRGGNNCLRPAPAAPTAGDAVRIYHRDRDHATGEITRTLQPGEYVIVRENRHGDWTVRCPRGTTHDVFRADVERIR